MKRFWALAIALAALVAWTVPALAEVKFGGEYRLRAEDWNETDFWDQGNSDDSDDNVAYYGQRVRLTGVATPTDDTTIKITIQDSRTWGMDSSTAGGGIFGPAGTDTWNNVLDLHESFLQINNFFGTPIAIKVGRQELVYGDQRLIGSFGWSNNGRSFDALKLMYSNDTVNVDAFTSKIEDNNGQFSWSATATPGPSDDDIDFHGIYATIKSIPNNTLDVYALLYRDGQDASVSGEIETDLRTYGTRLAGAIAGIDYTGEIAIQTGEADCAMADLCDIDAMAYAIKVGYAIPNNALGLRIGAEYAFASGDDDSADDDIETFTQLYPTNHDKYGYMDQQGWRNMKAWNLNVSAKPTAKLGVRVDYWNFSLAEEEDDWYNAGGNAPGLRSASCATCDDEMGAEIDITLNYKYNDAVGIQAGVSRFLAGDGIEDRLRANLGDPTADTEDMDWMYVQLTATF